MEMEWAVGALRPAPLFWVRQRAAIVQYDMQLFSIGGIGLDSVQKWSEIAHDLIGAPGTGSAQAQQFQGTERTTGARAFLARPVAYDDPDLLQSFVRVCWPWWVRVSMETTNPFKGRDT